jgi:hypothetical protein
MKKYHGNTVEYWKQNAEEDYIKTPISVLKYITVLEEQAEQLRKNAVIKSVCDCSSETFAHHYKGGDKCGYCGGKAES